MTFGLFLPRRYRELPMGASRSIDLRVTGAHSVGSLFGAGNRIEGLEGGWTWETQHTSTESRWKPYGLRLIADNGGSNDDKPISAVLPWGSAAASQMTSVVIFTRYVQTHIRNSIFGSPVNPGNNGTGHTLSVSDTGMLRIGYNDGNGYLVEFNSATNEWLASAFVGVPIVGVISTDPVGRKISRAMSIGGKPYKNISSTFSGSLSYIGGGGYTNGRVKIGNDDYPNYYGFNGVVNGIVLFNRFVPQAEADWLVENPGALWRNEHRRIYSLGTPPLPNTLFDKLNEETPNDNTYVSTSDLSTFEVALNAVDDPMIHTDHILKMRAKKTGTGKGVRVRLLQGSTVIETWELK